MKVTLITVRFNILTLISLHKWRCWNIKTKWWLQIPTPIPLGLDLLMENLEFFLGLQIWLSQSTASTPTLPLDLKKDFWTSNLVTSNISHFSNPPHNWNFKRGLRCIWDGYRVLHIVYITVCTYSAFPPLLYKTNIFIVAWSQVHSKRAKGVRTGWSCGGRGSQFHEDCDCVRWTAKRKCQVEPFF